MESVSQTKSVPPSVLLTYSEFRSHIVHHDKCYIVQSKNCVLSSVTALQPSGAQTRYLQSTCKTSEALLKRNLMNSFY